VWFVSQRRSKLAEIINPATLYQDSVAAKMPPKKRRKTEFSKEEWKVEVREVGRAVYWNVISLISGASVEGLM